MKIFTTLVTFLMIVTTISYAQPSYVVQMSQTTFGCGITQVSASTSCSFNGTISVTVLNNAPGVTISNISPVTGGNFSFTIEVTPEAALHVTLEFIVQTTNNPTGCAPPGSIFQQRITNNCVCDLSFVLTTQHETCYNCNNGTASLIVTGGSGMYTINWSNGQSGNHVGPLSPGAYAFTVVDTYGCSAAASFEINQYFCSGLLNVILHVSNESCLGCENGIATATVSGGSGNYSYDWSNGATTQTTGNLAPGEYLLIVTDIDNCTTAVAFTVRPYFCTGFWIIPEVEEALCYEDCTASIHISLSNNSQNFNVLWGDGSNEHIRENLCPGSYVVTVTDSDNCESAMIVVLSPPDPFEAELINIVPAMEGEGGEITIAFTGGQGLSDWWILPGDLEGSLNPFNNQVTFYGLVPGCYDILGMDQNGCTVSLDSVCIENLSSTKDLNNHSITLVPNPAYETFSIANHQIAGDFSINIYNTSGSLMLSKRNQTKIEIGHLPQGIYHVEIYNSNTVLTSRLVKM